MRALVLCVALAVGAGAAVTVRDGCGEDASVVAKVEGRDHVRVLHSVVGETSPCYAVILRHDGTDLNGYILGVTLPAIQEFERNRASAPAISAAPPVEPATAIIAPVLPSIGAPFEAWRGFDISGKRMEIAPASARATLVIFWAGGIKSSERLAKDVMKTESEFRAKGLKAFGFIEAPGIGRAEYYLDDMGLDYPQALNRQNMAAKYKANPIRGTILVIDSSSRIVASSSDPKEIRAAVAKLLSAN